MAYMRIQVLAHIISGKWFQNRYPELYVFIPDVIPGQFDQTGLQHRTDRQLADEALEI
jgi:hypothetical protein